MSIPVAALVSEELFATVQEQLVANRQRGRERKRCALPTAGSDRMRLLRLCLLRQEGQAAQLPKARCPTLRPIAASAPMPIASAEHACGHNTLCAPIIWITRSGTMCENCSGEPKLLRGEEYERRLRKLPAEDIIACVNR